MKNSKLWLRPHGHTPLWVVGYRRWHGSQEPLDAAEDYPSAER